MVTSADEKYGAGLTTDQFRIVIWDKADDDDTVVFDSLPDADVGVADTLIKGNIALHQVSVASAAEGQTPMMIFGNPPVDLLAKLANVSVEDNRVVIEI